MIYVCIAGVAGAACLVGYVLGWTSRGSYEVERRGGDFLDPRRR